MNEQYWWLAALALGLAAHTGGDYGDDIDTSIGDEAHSVAVGKGVRQRIGHELSQEIYLDKNRETWREITTYDIERLRDEIRSLRALVTGVIIFAIIGALIVITTTLITVRSYDQLSEHTRRNTEAIQQIFRGRYGP